MSDDRLGATEDEWFLFTMMLGLGADLLPAVANPNAQIASGSKLKSLGKTPSHYGSGRQVYGIGGWTEKHATPEELERWAKEPDYSICLIGRHVKAIDCDITDQDLSERIQKFIDSFIFERAGITLPTRFRNGSPKFLLAFRCSEETLKRVITTEHGIIEFLGNRQQFLVAGTHTSGLRYDWHGLDSDIPFLPLQDFEALWAALQAEFGTADEIRERERKAVEVDADEPMLKVLQEKNMILSKNREGGYNVICPFEGEHSSESVESATRYWPAHTGGFAHASIKCLHAHCASRSTEQFKQGLGIELTDGFEEVSDGFELAELIARPPPDPAKFRPVLALKFANDGSKQHWLVKYLIPASSVGYIYGASGTGKTFITLDIVASIARGIDWRGKKVRQGAVIYVCAEGSHGFRSRINAYCKHHGIDNPEGLQIYVIDAKPNIMDKAEMKALYAALEALDLPIACVVIDTYAACMIGDENAGTDVSKVIANVEALSKGFDTTVILVHHAGKDAGKGARGWSGLRSAVDFEFHVIQEGEVHALINTKMKDGSPPEGQNFVLKEVDLGEDEDGDKITSCVTEPTERRPLDTTATSKDTKVKQREADVFQAAQDIFGDTDVWPTQDELIDKVLLDKVHRRGDILKSIDVLLDSRELVEDADGRYSLSKK